MKIKILSVAILCAASLTTQSANASGATDHSKVNIEESVLEGSVVPELGTLALLVGCLALGSMMVRRRRI